MSARGTQEEVLPGMSERRRILEHAGTVLAEARSLLQCLDQAEGKLNVRGTKPSSVQQRVIIALPEGKRLPGSARWSS